MSELSRLAANVSDQLDSMRGLAAIVVLIAHTHQILLSPTMASGSKVVGYVAQFAVMVFFVLSGFLIGCSILTNIKRNGKFEAGIYILDRARRIYPPLMVSLVLTWVLMLIARHFFESGSSIFIKFHDVVSARQDFSITAEQTLAALTFSNGLRVAGPNANGPLWSLPFEVWYYVFAAAVFSFRQFKAISALAIVFVVMLCWKSRDFFDLLPVWVSGLLLAIAFFKGKTGYRVMAVAFFAVFAASAGIVILLAMRSGMPANQWLVDLNKFRIFSGLAFACLLWLVINGYAKFPRSFKRTSGFAYTLYIIHFPILLFIFGVFQTRISYSAAWAVVFSVVGIAVAVFAAYYVSLVSENKTLLKKLTTRQACQ